MIHDRETARRLAAEFALRGGLDPFESSLDAGITDATAGRIYGETTRRYRDNRHAYALGYALGRFTRLEWGFNSRPSVADAAAVVRRLDGSGEALRLRAEGRLKLADWFSWRSAAMALAGAAYHDSAAMTWHAAGRLPLDYAEQAQADAKQGVA